MTKPLFKKPRTLTRTRELRFFADDGVVRWVETRTTLNPDGETTSRIIVDPKPAGKRSGKYPTVTYEGRTRLLSHVAWEQHHQTKLPKGTRIKHLDGDPWNNRIENLVLVPRGGHQAITRIGGALVYLGSYPSAQDARDAVNAARAAVGMGPVKPRSVKSTL